MQRRPELSPIVGLAFPYREVLRCIAGVPKIYSEAALKGGGPRGGVSDPLPPPPPGDAELLSKTLVPTAGTNQSGLHNPYLFGVSKAGRNQNGCIISTF